MLPAPKVCRGPAHKQQEVQRLLRQEEAENLGERLALGTETLASEDKCRHISQITGHSQGTVDHLNLQ